MALSLTTRAEASLTLAPPVETTFVANPTKACTFLYSPYAPSFTPPFLSLNFNPPLGLIPGSPVEPHTQDFTNIQTNPDGTFLKGSDKVASGLGGTAGEKPFATFFATFTGSFVIGGSEQVPFDIYHDDGFVFGIDGGAIRLSGSPLVAPPTNGLTALSTLPVVAAYNRSSAPVKHTVIVQFPSAGTYHFEIDYFSCGGTTRTLTVFANHQPIPLWVATPTPTPTTTPTPTPTGALEPPATGSPLGPTATRTPSPIPTEPFGVSLSVGEAQGNPGDTVSVNVDFTPSRSDGKPHGPDEITVLNLVLTFDRLDFDATDTTALVFNPEGNPDLQPFALTVFNRGTAAADHTLDLQIVAPDGAGEILPSSTLLRISFKIPPRSPGGDLLIEPFPHPFDFTNTEQPVVHDIAGIVHAAPPPTRTETPRQPQVLVDTPELVASTSGGGCVINGNGSGATPLLALAALGWGRYRSRRRHTR